MLTNIVISHNPWYKKVTKYEFVFLAICDGCQRGFSRKRRIEPGRKCFCSKTCRNRTHAFLANTPSAKQKRANSLQDRYGCVNAYNLPETLARSHHPYAIAKGFETMKRNGTYATLKPEDKLYDVLCELFGQKNVVRQYVVHKWPIDFYVKSTDVYVQYDSYWHGFRKGVLRDLDEVAEHKNKRDIIIHRKMLIDIEQDRYFHDRRMKLIRVQNLTPEQITVDPMHRMGFHVDA